MWKICLIIDINFVDVFYVHGSKVSQIIQQMYDILIINK